MSSATTAEEVLHPVDYTLDIVDDLDSKWRVLRMSLVESLSDLYVCTLEISYPEADMSADDLIGKSCTLTLQRKNGERRGVNGIVHRLSYKGVAHGSVTVVRIEMVPALWVASQRVDSRIFQNKTAPEIVQEVLKEALQPYGRGLTLNLARKDYPRRENCVQYKESDLDFVMRLMQEEGITYSFDQTNDAEQLILVDANNAYDDNEVELNDGVIPISESGQGSLLQECITQLQWASAIRPAKVVVRDYDWTQPDLKVADSAEIDDKEPVKREIYVNDAALSLVDGTHDAAIQAKIRNEELTLGRKLGTGRGNVTEFSPGVIFTVSDQKQAGRNGKFLIIRVAHHGTQLDFVGGSGSPYVNDFDCISLDATFRPPRLVPSPVLPGPQTATVVGPVGEEVYTDKDGRIKVQFHWDRIGERNEHSSCWLRVAQTWGGPGFGTLFLPRIGMEVVVQFLNGDPDRPLVVGCVYNGSNKPPYELPADKTKSGIRTSSSPNSAGYNELTFEDAAGAEQIYLQAARDLNVVIENDEAQHVKHNAQREVSGNDRNLIKGHHTETIHQTDIITVGLARVLSVGGAYAQNVVGAMNTLVGGVLGEEVAGARIELVGGSKREEIRGHSSLTVNDGETRTIISGLTEDIEGNVNRNITDGNIHESVEGNVTCEVKKNKTEMVDGNKMLEVKGAETIQVDGGIEMISGTEISIEAKASLMIKVGGSTFEVKPDGIKLKSAKIDIEASGPLTLKGNPVQGN